MSSVILTVLDKKETPKSTYVLGVEWYHAEGGATTDEVIYFPVEDVNKMELLPLIIDILERQDDYEETIRYITEKGTAPEHPLLTYINAIFWPYDFLYEHAAQRADIAGYSLTYFDANGVEKIVKVEHLN